MLDKSKLVPGTPLRHRNRGACLFTEQCKWLEDLNPDQASVFVYVLEAQDILEVSLNQMEEVL
jgi:hypothetical protein